MIMSDEYTVDQELELDLRIFGTCFWRLVDGEKVRIPHEQVLIEGDRMFTIQGKDGDEIYSSGLNLK